MKLDLTKKKTLYILAIVIGGVVIAGPELGIGFELLATVELFGLELFILCLVAPFWFYLYRLESLLQKIDPYFFLPSKQQVLATPGILAHAVPGYMVLLLWGASMFALIS